MQALSDLEREIDILMQQYKTLQEENEQLREKNEQQRSEILHSHAELVALRSDYTKLRLAAAMTGNEETRDAAKRKLSGMIAQIDKALEMLKN